ncbi:MAG: PSD1 and planctomycete cytochrome C domain-containing protein [Acidobacteriota bacterium]|nr:PSD1 and planctomycete cytochrome C domain-containing protein [Acidobacteriota bacterium]
MGRCLAIVFLAAAARAQSPVSYTRQIQPLLEERCRPCHWSDSRTSGFSIFTLASLIKGGNKDGPAIIPGKPAESPLIQRVRGSREPRMPRGREPLSDLEISMLEAWIKAGAPDDTPLPMDDSQPLVATHASHYQDEQLLNQLLFAENSEQVLKLRRAVRLALVPVPPDPPQLAPPFFHPVDAFIAGKWKDLPEFRNPPPLCDDSTFLRRVYLDLIGVIPTAEEARRFLANPSPGKREKLVDDLLARNAEYAAHWTPFWEDAIASSDTGILGGFVRHGDYSQWIFDGFVKNKPYDIFAAELIDPTMPGYQKPKPQTLDGGRTAFPQYVLNSSHLETIQTASNVAQTFLGTGMKCASCHDHFLSREWPQARFLAFAGMFAAHDLEVIRCEAKTGSFVAAKFPFNLPDAPADAPRDATARLHRVAQLLTDPTNDRFSKTIVNRLWKRYLGLGLFEPADDFRADRASANDPLLAWLAYDFMLHGYDLKHTIRLILTSRTYQTRYDPSVEDHYNLAKPAEPRYYRSPALRRLTAEQLLDSIRVAGGEPLGLQDRLYRQRKSTDLTRALGKPAARNEVSTARSGDVAVVQALELLNGSEFYNRVYSAPILKTDVTPEALYWSALSRPPTPEELRLAEAFLKTNPPGDMLWALVATPGFQYVH